MARPVGAYGRPGYGTLVDERWAEHNAVTAERTLTSHVKIALPDTKGEYDEETHTRPTIPGVVLYDDIGRIQAIGDLASVEVAGQMVTTTRYRVDLRRDAPLIKVGTTIKITDPSAQLDGQTMIVTAFTFDSLRFTTNMMAESNQG